MSFAQQRLGGRGHSQQEELGSLGVCPGDGEGRGQRVGSADVVRGLAFVPRARLSYFFLSGEGADWHFNKLPPSAERRGQAGCGPVLVEGEGRMQEALMRPPCCRLRTETGSDGGWGEGRCQRRVKSLAT